MVIVTNANNQVVGVFSGNGAGLTNLSLPVANLIGTLAAGQIPSLDASKIASGTSAFSYGASQKSWLDVFWNAVNVTPGTQYFLAFNAGGQLQDMNAYAAPGNAYANGSSLYQNYPGGADTSPYVNGYPNDDTAFREYASTAPVATPEPASMVLMATGLIGVVGIARRRRIGSNSAEV